MLRKKIWFLGTLVLAVVGAKEGLAWYTPPANPYPPSQLVAVLDTVSETGVRNSRFVVVGTGVGTSSVTEWWGPGSTRPEAEACHRAALLMMNRPGRFRLRLINDGYDYCVLVAR